MVKFLFWNIDKKPLETVIANIARVHEIDVLILAECDISLTTMLYALNRDSTEYQFSADTKCEKLAIYTRFSTQFIEPLSETGRWSIRRLALPLRTEILLAAAHMPDKQNHTAESQAYESAELARDIKRVEEQVGHARTVLVGDLNMDPFEGGVYAAAGLNAAMTKEIARRETRTVQGRQYDFFYNPMWGHFGDRTVGPPGTYYYHRAEHTTLFWHMFDQVLLRPELVDHFCDEELEILTSDENIPFLSAKGLPDAKIVSDHLPLLFALNL